MTKELAETLRRTNREECAGVLHFAYVSWFKNVWNVKTIEPLPTTLSDALQPVLVSVELYGRHFYAGSTTSVRVCIVNDSETGGELPPGKLIWQVNSGNTIPTGALHTSPVEYYSNVWGERPRCHFPPTCLPPPPRVNATLTLLLEVNGEVQSKNSHDIAIGTRSWAKRRSSQPVAILSLQERCTNHGAANRGSRDHFLRRRCPPG